MRIKSCLFGLLLFVSCEIFSQSPPEEITVCFYNVENLFDLRDDPDVADGEFTPAGVRRWTGRRLDKKLLDISKTLLSASGWEPPRLIGVCEVENRYVLERLIRDTPLCAFPYGIIHKESPDRRGMDVAFLYHKDYFHPLRYQSYPVRTARDSILTTREILYVSGIVRGTDTLHLFINHWPSRYSGLLESQPDRNLAARTLKKQVERLQLCHKDPCIVIMGDFNDQPTDESISEHLRVAELPDSGKTIRPAMLYNLSLPWMEHDRGTIKYRSQWSVFDQIIVSGSLLDPKNKLFTRPEWARIVTPPFLLEADKTYGGIKTRRTYFGYRYSGGTSDHLPVILRLRINR
jgi:hypothetical protein